MAAYWQTAKGEVADLMNSPPKVVVSRTLERADWANTTLAKDDLVTEIQNLKRNGNAFVFGSANLSAALTAQGLFDEYRLGLAPVLLGLGRKLFDPSPSKLSLKLLEARTLKSGCLILRYEPRQNQ
jgi:dihydrofolate reductase